MHWQIKKIKRIHLNLSFNALEEPFTVVDQSNFIHCDNNVYQKRISIHPFSCWKKKRKQTPFQFGFFFIVAAFFWVIFAYTCIWNWMLSISLTLVFYLFPIHSRWLSIDGIMKRNNGPNTNNKGQHFSLRLVYLYLWFVRTFIVVVFLTRAYYIRNLCTRSIHTFRFYTTTKFTLVMQCIQ